MELFRVKRSDLGGGGYTRNQQRLSAALEGEEKKATLHFYFI